MKMIRLYAVYTALSILISILAWLAVSLDLVSVSAELLQQIRGGDVALAALVYGLGAAWLLDYSRSDAPNLSLLLCYVVAQIACLSFSYVTLDWWFAPAAGSQGTIPAVVISVVAVGYLLSLEEEQT